MAKVYLETSFFSACVSVRRTPKAMGWRDTSMEWWHKCRPNHELFVSAEVIAELANPAFQQSDEALQLLQGIPLLHLTDEVKAFADLLVMEKVMPGPAVVGDAVHVAVAAIHRMDFILTWNARHLANPNKRTHFATIYLKVGIAPPQIVTPDLLQD